ncbi:1-(5-phosphoribosyl)-5-((5-phosphoribosylamino)methylideneamino)imidazole-4-carboxamide isomerase, partial [Pseudomonas sp. CM25]|nr:1-(5-phosphoribosyl)-5-((5-phosphoribosylamino)methylideneamino)imidazole-4-carboxamide isomerase [Pseudomonas sp. CM25]
WEYLEQLCLRQAQLWAEYLDELHKAGKSRDPAEAVVKLML